MSLTSTTLCNVGCSTMFLLFIHIWSAVIINGGLTWEVNSGKQILAVFPHNSGYRHIPVYFPLLWTLAQRGHNVTVITNFKSEKFVDGPLPTYNEYVLKNAQDIEVIKLTKNLGPSNWFGLGEFWSLHEEGKKACKRLYTSGYVQKVLHHHRNVQKYDLLITEYLNSDCQLGLAYLMGLPVVAMSSCLLKPWYYKRILMPDTPSYIQSGFVGFPEPLDYSSRLSNYVQATVLPFLYWYWTNSNDNHLIRKHLGVEDIDVEAVAREHTRLIFGNQPYSLTGVRPHSQQFVEVGGIHINEGLANASLPDYLNNFLKSSDKDVLVISWGSRILASSMDENVKKRLMLCLESFRVIWKWDSDKIRQYRNFLFVNWLPQLSLLCHPKVRYFWGHGGMLSTTEALFCGKPMLVTPFYGDQFTNAHAIANRGMGVIVSYFDIVSNISQVKVAIQQLKLSRYRQNAKDLSDIFRDREKEPLDTAIWWVEHLLKYPQTNKLLHSHAVHMNWFVFNSLDSIISIEIILLFILNQLVRSKRVRRSRKKRRPLIRAVATFVVCLVCLNLYRLYKELEN